MEKNYILILVATKDKLEAEKITKALLNERLIACGNITGPVTSYFHWSGQIEKSEECLVVMKSRTDLFAQVTERVKGLHSYEVPEILALPIADGSKTYLDWMSAVLQ
ncbi:MAG: divalent-cation tolerance protein CutA [Candidatus Bathyarchaeia archaeon]